MNWKNKKWGIMEIKKNSILCNDRIQPRTIQLEEVSLNNLIKEVPLIPPNLCTDYKYCFIISYDMCGSGAHLIKNNTIYNCLRILSKQNLSQCKHAKRKMLFIRK